MAKFLPSVITELGEELLAKTIAGSKIEFTRLVTGKGSYQATEKERDELRKCTQLKNEVQEFTFSSIQIVNKKSVLLRTIISNKDIDFGYEMTEIGVCGREVGTEDEILVALSVAEIPDYFPAYNGLRECQIVQEYYITVSDTSNVSITVDGGATLLVEDFLAYKESMDESLESLVKINIGPAEAEIENNTIHLIDRAKKIRDLIFKKKNGTAETYEIAVKAENVETDANHLFVTNVEKQAISNPQDNTITFTQATTRINIASGLSLGTNFGRIMKWFADMGTVAFCTIANNDTTTAAGYAADARIVRTHGIEIDNIATDMGGLKFSYEGGKFYVQAGADTGSKKQLGNSEVLFSDLKLQFAGGRTSATSATDSTRRSAVFSMAVDVTDHDVLYIGSYTVDRSSSHADGKPDYAIVCQIDGVEYTLDPNGTSIDVSGKSKVNLSLSFSSDMGTYYSVSGTITVSEISLS